MSSSDKQTQPQVLVQEGNTIRAAPQGSNPMSARGGTGGTWSAPNNPEGNMPQVSYPGTTGPGQPAVGSKVGLASGGDSRLQSVTGGAGTNLESGDKPAGGDAYPQEERVQRDSKAGDPMATAKMD
ncbi:hypothetical protein N2152v2_009402 [Parachlorella kessleri]